MHGLMVEQELLHLIHLQKMNCLISFTREMEEDINQERDNFRGLKASVMSCNSLPTVTVSFWEKVLYHVKMCKAFINEFSFSGHTC